MCLSYQWPELHQISRAKYKHFKGQVDLNQCGDISKTDMYGHMSESVTGKGNGTPGLDQS